jgi:hypothetical protein
LASSDNQELEKNKEKYLFLLWRFPSCDSVCVEVQKSLQEQEDSSYGQGFEDLIVRYKRLGKFDDYV